jgi:hypothetical protein
MVKSAVSKCPYKRIPHILAEGDHGAVWTILEYLAPTDSRQFPVRDGAI